MSFTAPVGGEPMSVTRFVGTALKGAAMGAANVIPGVSGGTIALISGIYQELIDTLKSFGWGPLKQLTQGQFKKCFESLNGPFVCTLGIGLAASIITLAKLLESLLANHEILTMAFFFGLILASAFIVAKQVPKWNPITGLALLIGIAIAAAVLLLEPLQQNANPGYLFLCGVIAICSMILPGISGSFILILMGNYGLVIGAIGNIRDFKTALPVLIPFGLGCAVGLLGFARALSYVLDKFKAATLAGLTGFVIGSLAVIWPWKTEITKQFEDKVKVTGYEWNYPVPEQALFHALLLMLAGAGLVLILDRIAGPKPASTKGKSN